MRDFVADMGKSDPDAIVSENARRALSEYKEGERMYDKIELAFKERFKDDYKRAEIEGERKGRESGLKEGTKIEALRTANKINGLDIPSELKKMILDALKAK